MNSRNTPACPECTDPVDRRTFIRTVGSVVLAGAAAPALLSRVAHAAPTAKSAAETKVVEFYNTLSAAQKQVIVLPFDHDLRQRINANWHVTKPVLDDDFYTVEQRALADAIVRSVTSEDGYQRIKKQTDDDSGGIGAYSIAVFGTPGSGKFEWELTGRHLTLRADGDSVDKAAFGGPIIYGHGQEDPGQNMFHYQTKKANEVFKALDVKQAARALIGEPKKEAEVALQGDRGAFPGIPVGELSPDQKQLVESTLKVLLAPYRTEDVDEVFEILKATGGSDKLHMAFYQMEDLQNDKEWDIWRIEGPGLVWHFRGAPHVHAYINIGVKS